MAPVLCMEPQVAALYGLVAVLCMGSQRFRSDLQSRLLISYLSATRNMGGGGRHTAPLEDGSAWYGEEPPPGSAWYGEEPTRQRLVWGGGPPRQRASEPASERSAVSRPRPSPVRGNRRAGPEFELPTGSRVEKKDRGIKS